MKTRRVPVVATPRINENSAAPALLLRALLQAVLMLAAAVADAFRPRRALLAEIALIRHQLTLLQRSVAR